MSKLQELRTAEGLDQLVKKFLAVVEGLDEHAFVAAVFAVIVGIGEETRDSVTRDANLPERRGCRLRRLT